MGIHIGQMTTYRAGNDFHKSPVCRIIVDILEISMNIEMVRKLAEREEIDYQFLLSTLSEYARPRDKISEWLKSGDLIRVKKGLYVFGEHIALTPYSHEILANLIYGPSAISLSYALAFYGLIPERVTVQKNQNWRFYPIIFYLM